MTNLHRTLRLLPLAWLLAFAGVPAAAATIGHGVYLNEKDDAARGEQEYKQLLQTVGRYDDEAVQSYVNEVGQRVAAKSDRPDLKFTFTVLDSEEINAFATDGGYIYIYRGLLGYLNSEAELAAVLGHEIGHVTARHLAHKRAGGTLTNIGATVLGVLTGSGAVMDVAGMAGSAIVSGYGRDQELEADGLGAKFISRVGYDPEAMIDVVRLLKNQEMLELQMARTEGRQPHVYHGVFASHPDNDTRLHEVVKVVGKDHAVDHLPDNRAGFLAKIDGLAVGPSRAQGVARGSRFYHADLGVTFAFPSGWTIQNMPDRVLAFTPAKDAAMIVSAQGYPSGMTPQQFVARLVNGVATSDARELDVNGLPAYSVIVSNTQLPWGNPGPLRLAVVYYNNLAYVFKAATKYAGALKAQDPIFLSSIGTFRKLKDTEYELAEPDRLRVITAGAGTRVEDLAKSSPIQKFPVEQLRLYNDLYPDKEPADGQQIKVVE